VEAPVLRRRLRRVGELRLGRACGLSPGSRPRRRRAGSGGTSAHGGGSQSRGRCSSPCAGVAQRALGQRQQAFLTGDVLRLIACHSSLRYPTFGLSRRQLRSPSWCPSAGSRGSPGADCLRGPWAADQTSPGWPRRRRRGMSTGGERRQRIGCATVPALPDRHRRRVERQVARCAATMSVGPSAATCATSQSGATASRRRRPRRVRVGLGCWCLRVVVADGCLRTPVAIRQRRVECEPLGCRASAA
jgi:hypothetical protein